MKCKSSTKCSELSAEEKKTPQKKTKKGKKIPSNQQYSYSQLDTVETAKYEKNALVFFLNSERAIHSVTPRQPTPFR
jgi:hypothetical protein